MRCTVHDGALHVENCVHAVVRDTLADFLLGSATAAAAAGGEGGRSGALRVENGAQAVVRDTLACSGVQRRWWPPG